MISGTDTSLHRRHGGLAVPVALDSHPLGELGPGSIRDRRGGARPRPFRVTDEPAPAPRT